MRHQLQRQLLATEELPWTCARTVSKAKNTNMLSQCLPVLEVQTFKRTDSEVEVCFDGRQISRFKYHQTYLFLFQHIALFHTIYTGLHCIMSKDVLIDTHVSLKQCRQAVEALHSHELKKKEKSDETQLLPGKEQHIWLNVTVKQIPIHYKLKPLKMYVSSMF